MPAFLPRAKVMDPACGGGHSVEPSDTSACDTRTGFIRQHKPATSRKIASRLLELPQELLDTIFDYAYAQDDRLTNLPFGSWEDGRFNARLYDLSHAAVPSPRPKIGDFMVSKRFFQAATRSYISKQCFDLGTITEAARNCRHTIGGTPEGCLISESVTYVEINCFDPTEAYFDLPCLQKLSIHLTESMFDCLAPKHACNVTLDRSDFAKTKIYTFLVMLRGLKEFSVTSDEFLLSAPGNAHAEAIWRKNVRKFELIVRAEVTKPRNTVVRAGQIPGGVTPLYPGSAVCLDSNELRSHGLQSWKLAETIDKRLGVPLPQFSDPYVHAETDLNGAATAVGDLLADVVDSGGETRNDDVHAFLRKVLVYDPDLLEKVLMDRARMFAATTPLNDSQIPETAEDLVSLIVDDASGILGWITDAKNRMDAARTEAQSLKERLSKFEFMLAEMEHKEDAAKASLAEPLPTKISKHGSPATGNGQVTQHLTSTGVGEMDVHPSGKGATRIPISASLDPLISHLETSQDVDTGAEVPVEVERLEELAMESLMTPLMLTVFCLIWAVSGNVG